MKRNLGCILSVIALETGVCVAASQQSLPRIDLGAPALEQLTAGKVSELQTLDSQACRVIQPDQPAVFAVNPWWGEAVQPAAETLYVAAVRYRDTLKQPAVFLSYAGLGGNEGPSEMHRFGGLSDDQWKTARVPLSWDMVLRDFDTGKVRLGIRTSSALPVASIEIQQAQLADEQHYNAETREWVRRAQGDLEPAHAPQSQPVIPEAMVRQPIVPYVRPYVRPILPQDVPQQGEAGTPLRVRMALNEYEPAAFAVYAAAETLTNVTYKLAELANDAGKLAVEVQHGTVEYTLRSQKDKPAHVVAERIWPMYAADIQKGQSQWLWITLKTGAANSKPGKYTGTITIKADQGRAALPIEVEVLPIRLVSLDRAALQYGGCHPALLPAHEMRELLEHNLNIMNIWANVGPRVTIKDGKMALDFRFFDYWMKQAGQSGIEAFVWFLGGVPYGYPRTLSIERELYIALHAGEKSRPELYDEFVRVAAKPENRGRTLPEVEPYYRQWVREVYNHAVTNGWPELIMTPFDEAAMWVQGPYRKESGNTPGVIGAGPWIRDHFEFAANLMHESAPKMRVYASIHHNHVPPADYEPPKDDEYPPMREGQVFLDDVDILCTNAIDEDPQLGDKTRVMGKDFWQYSGVGAVNRPDRVRYTFGFFFSGYNSRGGLAWAYDWGSGFDTSRGSSTYLAWRTPFDVIPSPDYECMREALDDRRYVETLKRLAADHQTDVREFLEELSRQSTGLRTAGGRDTVTDFWAEASDPNAPEILRRRVVDQITDVQKHGWKPAPLRAETAGQ